MRITSNDKKKALKEWNKLKLEKPQLEGHVDATKQKPPSSETISRQLERHLSLVSKWLLNPRQQLPKTWKDTPPPHGLKGIPEEQQLKIYWPSSKIHITRKNSKTISSNLPFFLKEMKQREKTPAEPYLLSIPIYFYNRWTVLTLHFNEQNQLCSACYIDSLTAEQPISLPSQHPIVKLIKLVHPDFQHSVLQYQHYHHSDKALSRFIAAENAADTIKRFYYGKHFPFNASPWTNMPTPQTDPNLSTLEALPPEIKLHALKFLPHRDLASLFGCTSKANADLADSDPRWKHLYQALMRYTVIPTPGEDIPEPTCYRTAIKPLYLSLMPEERTLIKAAFDKDQKTLNRYIDTESLKNRFRDRLLIIAACDGDTEILAKLECSYLDVERLVLVNYSIHTENRQAVLDHFWSLVIKTNRDTTLAHWAAILNQSEALSQQIEKNSRLTTKANLFGITPLMFANYYGHTDCMSILQRQSPLHAVTPTNPKQNASHNLLKSLKTYNNYCIPILLKQGADPDYIEKYISPLQPLIKKSFTTLLLATRHCHLEIARLLLRHNADVDIQDEFLNTPLIIAADKGRKSMISLLLSHGAKINHQSCLGHTALIHAAMGGNEDIIHTLIAKGADLNLTTRKGQSAYKMISKRYHPKGAVMLAVAMFLKPSHEIKAPTLENAYQLDPNYFMILTKEIINNRQHWPWVTDEMRNRILQDPFIQTLIEEKEEQEKGKEIEIEELAQKGCVLS